MRKKVLAISLSLMFFGSVATSTFAMDVVNENTIVNVDDDKDKNKKKAKTASADAKTEKSGECSSAAKSECAKSCDDKKSATAKK